MTLRFITLVAIIIAALLAFAWHQSGVRAAEYTLPQGAACVDPAGAVERLSALPGLSILPRISVHDSNGYIVNWSHNGEVYGFLVMGKCAVVGVFWLGNHKPNGTPA